MGTFLAALNVAYRDFRYVIPFLIQVWMFATPTVYMQPSGSEGCAVRGLLALNPMTGLVGGFRASLLGGDMPWAGLAIATAGSLALFVAGCLYFRKIEDSFADMI